MKFFFCLVRSPCKHNLRRTRRLCKHCCFVPVGSIRIRTDDFELAKLKKSRFRSKVYSCVSVAIARAILAFSFKTAYKKLTRSLVCVWHPVGSGVLFIHRRRHCTAGWIEQSFSVWLTTRCRWKERDGAHIDSNPSLINREKKLIPFFRPFRPLAFVHTVRTSGSFPCECSPRFRWTPPRGQWNFAGVFIIY